MRRSNRHKDVCRKYEEATPKDRPFALTGRETYSVPAVTGEAVRSA